MLPALCIGITLATLSCVGKIPSSKERFTILHKTVLKVSTVDAALRGPMLVSEVVLIFKLDITFRISHGCVGVRNMEFGASFISVSVLQYNDLL